MGEKEFVLELSELTQLTFRCKHRGCDTSMTFQVDGTSGHADMRCPGCGRACSQIAKALGAFREFLRAATIDDIDTRIPISASVLAGLGEAMIHKQSN